MNILKLTPLFLFSIVCFLFAIISLFYLDEYILQIIGLVFFFIFSLISLTINIILKFIIKDSKKLIYMESFIACILIGGLFYLIKSNFF